MNWKELSRYYGRKDVERILFGGFDYYEEDEEDEDENEEETEEDEEEEDDTNN